MRFLIILFLAALAGTLLLLGGTASSSRPAPSLAARPLSMSRDSAADSLAEAFQRAQALVSSPELEKRRQARRTLQREGYADVLIDACRLDAPSALASLIRMNARIEFHLSHRPLEVYFPVSQPQSSVISPFMRRRTSGLWMVTIHDDWSMPEDPWK